MNVKFVNEKAFYRKYKPNSFKEIIGQNLIVKTLQNQIINNRLSHSYIFYGPKGIGKTSIAKIFSKSVNCLNFDKDCCNKCNNCISINKNATIDLIELDAASHNGVNDIRNIIDTISYLPSLLNKKIYIIDEAHMLSISAWNALLKTIEDPPSYLIFIFATTELNKFPATIISRCQRFNFLKLNKIELNQAINNIVLKQNIKIEKQAINKLISISDGSLRDACSLLDQLDSYSNSNIKQKDINDLIGIVDDSQKVFLLQEIINNNLNSILNLINNYQESGVDFYLLTHDLIEILYDKLIFLKTKNTSLIKKINEEDLDKLNLNHKQTVDLIEVFHKALFDIKNSFNNFFYFQITCFKAIEIFDENNIEIKNPSSNLKSIRHKFDLDQKINKELKFYNQIKDNNSINPKNELDDLIDKSYIENYLNEKDLKSNYGLLNNQKKEGLSSFFDENNDNQKQIKNKINQEKLATKQNLIDKKSITKTTTLKDNQSNQQNFEQELLFHDLQIEDIKDFFDSDFKVKNGENNNLISIKNEKIDDLILRIVIHNDKSELLFYKKIFEKLKLVPPTNKIESYFYNIKDVIVASKQAIIVTCENQYDIENINNNNETHDFIKYLNEYFNKIFLIVATSKTNLKKIAEKIKKNNLNKKNVEKINIEYLFNIKNESSLNGEQLINSIFSNEIEEED